MFFDALAFVASQGSCLNTRLLNHSFYRNQCEEPCVTNFYQNAEKLSASIVAAA